MEHTNDNNQKMKEKMKAKIMQRIAERRVIMRPRVYFALRLAAVIVVAALFLVVSIALSNFILFTIRINGHDSLLHFGPRGFVVFMRVFPWILLAVDALLVALLEMLLRKFRFGYKSPVLYLLLIIFSLSISLGLFIDRTTHWDDRFEPQARIHHHLGDDMCRCTITAINGNIIRAEDRDDETSTSFTIMVPLDDHNATTSGLRVGETIFVVGNNATTGIEAFGIRPLPPTPPQSPVPYH